MMGMGGIQVRVGSALLASMHAAVAYLMESESMRCMELSFANAPSVGMRKDLTL